MREKTHEFYHSLSLLLVPAILVVFSVIYRTNRQLYLHLLSEDLYIEWLTVFFLFLSGAFSGFIAFRLMKYNKEFHWFYVVFSLACLFFAGEEMSWGQRIFGVSTPDFFLTNSTQPEINIHNVIQRWYHIKTRVLSAVILGVWGTVFPLLGQHTQIKQFFRKIRFVTPPLILSLSFLISALLMIDKPTGQEEELGECCFSICFFLFIMNEMYLVKSKTDSFDK